ncbi:MAG: Gfo/Idh/MocA family oxidoreductase [Caldilineaceae bacterium]|nr:Gfo/Idh/MocA family oxidoreductase [Caldilineaceae bacterium]
MTSPIRLGLIGAGTFARKAHVPSLKNLPDQFEIVAVYSRTSESAAAVAAMLPHPVDLYTDAGMLLARADVEAVDIVLPIPMLVDAVRQALAAGKHVISEKPIAPTCAEAEALIDFYKGYTNQLWMVAENWRYEDAFLAAGEAIRRGEIGRPLYCDWSLILPVMPGAPGHRTLWRRTGDFPGGFLIDGGVHHAAGLRAVLGEIESVNAITAAHRPDLPPADTLIAALHFTNGAVGSYSVTYAARSGLADAALHVIGEEGSLRISAETLTIWREKGETTQSFPLHLSVERELAAFAESIRNGVAHRNPPQEALRDLAVIEAMLRSAETGTRQKVAEVTR